jgi:pilus assembly protein FimV
VRNLRLIITFWLASFAMPGISFALGLGEINVSSFLNQPLKAEIAVISARPGEIDNLGVRLASTDSFARAGLSRPSHLTDLRFEVKKSEGGDQATVLVTSKNAVKEPFLNFLVEADWSKGRMLREFTVLLDPPFFDESQSSDSVIAVTIKDEVAPIASPNVVNTTEVNAAESIAASVTASDISNADPDSVVVAKGNSLWSIASQFKDSEHSMAQVMLAMQRANLDAFSNNNINNLKVGAVFRAPTVDELDQLNKQEAYAQVLEQHGRWDKTVRKVTEPSVAIGSGDGVEIKQNANGDFSLLTPGDSDSESASQSEGGDENSTLKNQLALAEEQLDASQIEKQEMQSRIADLEARLSKFDELQKMLEIEDDSLAQLQAGQTNDSLEENASQNKSTAISEEVAEEGELVEGSQDKDLSILDRILPLGIINLIPSMSWFFSNPIAFGGLSGLVILLFGLFLYRRRKSSEDDGDAGITLSDVDLDESPSNIDNDTMPINIAQRTDDADDKSLPANAMSQVDQAESTHEVTYSAVPAEQDDLLNEVDVYLAYGLYDNAKELLAQSLEANPDRNDYRAKLLDTYFATKNIDGFVKEATLLKSNDRSAYQYWDKVQVMGYELAPDNALFSAGKDSNIRAADLEVVKPQMTDFELGISEDDMDDLSNTDFNLDESINDFDDVQPLQGDADTLSLPDTPELETFEFTLDVETEGDDLDDVSDTNLDAFVHDREGLESNETEDISLDFDLDEAEDLLSKSDSDLYVAESNLEPTDDIKDPIDENINLSQSGDDFNLDIDDISLMSAQDADEDIQFNLDESDEAFDSDSLSLDDIDNSDETIPPHEVDINDIGDLMLPDDVDEVATKLDLARAFIDMGDAEGARDSLEEVLAEGTGEQKAEASQLLENM